MSVVLFQSFYEGVNPVQFLGNVDGLGAMLVALATSYAMTGLAESGHAPVVSDEEGAACVAGILVQLVVGDVSFVDKFIRR